MWLLDTFDNLSEYLQQYKNAVVVGEYVGLTLKKNVTSVSVYYGLFDGEALVAYYWLITFPSQHRMIRGVELRVDKRYQRKGIAMFLYNHILLADGYVIISDYSHSVPSGNMWDKFRTMSELQIGTYNFLTDSINWSCPINEEVYGNDYMHFVVRVR